MSKVSIMASKGRKPQPNKSVTPVARRAAKPVAPRTPAPVAPQPTEAAAPADPIETITAAAAAPTIKETQIMQDTVKKTAAQAETMFADVNDRAKSAMEKSSKMVAEMNDFAKGNIEAMVESSKIAAKGFETIGQDAAEYGRKHFESATAAMKQFASVKSPTDLFKLQSDYLRSAFDSLVAETSKNTEAMLKLAGDVAQPLSSRAAVAAEKIKLAA